MRRVDRAHEVRDGQVLQARVVREQVEVERERVTRLRVALFSYGNNAYDPKANINAGVQKLKALLEKWEGNISLALASYNAGEGAVAKFNGIPPYRETQKYVSRILAIAGLR